MDKNNKSKTNADVDLINKEMLETIDKMPMLLDKAPLHPYQKRAVISAVNAMTQEINRNCS